MTYTVKLGELVTKFRKVSLWSTVVSNVVPSTEYDALEKPASSS